jgi:hypothetical protein
MLTEVVKEGVSDCMGLGVPPEEAEGGGVRETVLDTEVAAEAL